jgi:hypothetical protein
MHRRWCIRLEGTGRDRSRSPICGVISKGVVVSSQQALVDRALQSPETMGDGIAQMRTCAQTLGASTGAVSDTNEIRQGLINFDRHVTTRMAARSRTGHRNVERAAAGPAVGSGRWCVGPQAGRRGSTR